VVAPGGRYRYEGRSGYGAAVVVSDGATQWTYHPYDHLYTQHPAPPQYPTSGSIIPHEETSTMTATEIKGEISGFASTATMKIGTIPAAVCRASKTLGSTPSY